MSWQNLMRKGKISYDHNFFTILLALLLFLILPCLYECDNVYDYPTLNKCCPQGSFYNEGKDVCVELSAGLKEDFKVQDNSFPTDMTGDNFISVPSDLVIDLSNKSSTPEDFRFRLRPYFPIETCNKGNFIVVVQLNKKFENEPTGSIKPQLQPGNSSMSLLSPQNIQLNFTSRGQIKIRNDYYSPPEYCIIGLKDEILTLRICNATCTGETPCIRKCCDLNQVWNIARGKRQGCFPAGQHLWNPELYKTPSIKATKAEINQLSPHYTIIHPRSFCNSSTVPLAIEQRDGRGRNYWKFRINTEGHVFNRISRYTWEDQDDHPDSYCLDGAINSLYFTEETNQTEFSGAVEDGVLFECLPPRTVSRQWSYLYGSLMVFSCFLLLLTVLVHVLLWDKQPNHAWTLTLISYDLSLFCLYLSLTLMHISQFYIYSKVQWIKSTFFATALIIVFPNDITFVEFLLCLAVGNNFFFLSTFCWMSAVNFDLYLTFKVLKETTGRFQGLWRYLGYSIFAWTVPIIIVTVGIILDFMYRNDFDSGIVVPEYGRKVCQLDKEYALLVYSFGPAGILLIFNLICFTFTVYTMYSVQKATNNSSKKNKQTQSLKLFAKLLFVMGFPWIFEIISWFVERGKSDEIAWYWVCFDVINLLQALAIFWTFVCQPEVIRMLEQKYPRFELFLDHIMLDSNSAEKNTSCHPVLKRFLKPITRRNKDVSSVASSTTANGSMKRGDVKMEEGKLSTKSDIPENKQQ